jgi:hypothetical protein
LPSVIAIMAIAGRINLASFIVFILILFFLRGCSAMRRIRLKSQTEGRTSW